MDLYRGYKFRIYPNKKQQQTIAQIISSCNFVYNYFINKEEEYYKETDRYLPVNQCIKELPALKKEYPELKKGESTSLQQTLRHLDKAFINYFKGRALKPRYKSNALDRSYTCTRNGCTPSNIRIEDGMLVLPKLGKVKVNFHHQLPEGIEITSVTVRESQSGKYEASIQTVEKVEIKDLKEEKVLGIVYSPEFFFIASNGEFGEIPESYQKALDRIEQLREKVRQKREGSKNRMKAKCKLKKAYERAHNIKNDYLHKWSRELVRDYDTVVIKEFNPELFDEKTSGKEGWNQFISYLKYKLEEKGGKLVIISNGMVPKENITDFSYGSAVEYAQKLTTLID